MNSLKLKVIGIAAAVLLAPLSSPASVGVKAGLNFANVTNAASINASSRSGFMAGVFIGPGSEGWLGFRAELLYSRQGYDFDASAATGAVNLDYLLMPLLAVVHLGHIIQIQAGGQLAYLLKPGVEGGATGDPASAEIPDFFKRLDYGLAGGVEISPFMGLLVGARINLSFGNLYKKLVAGPGGTASFFPSLNAKNNVVQIYAGYRF
jgi:hypothetical protein